MLIPSNYWEGEHTLELGYPWLTPESICLLEQFCTDQMTVLELGSGGSTIFFALRCQRVNSFETEKAWSDQVQTYLQRRFIQNAQVFYIHDPVAYKNTVDNQPIADIVLLDCYPNVVARPPLIETCLAKARKLFILDNYNAFGCQNIDRDTLYRGWERRVFDDLHWFGNGTEILIKK